MSLNSYQNPAFKELEALIKKYGWIEFIICFKAYVSDRMEGMKVLSFYQDADRWSKVFEKIKSIPKNLRI